MKRRVAVTYSRAFGFGGGGNRDGEVMRLQIANGQVDKLRELAPVKAAVDVNAPAARPADQKAAEVAPLAAAAPAAKDERADAPVLAEGRLDWSRRICR